MKARIHIDRLVLDGLPNGTTPAALERAIRAALRSHLAGAAPVRPLSAPSLRLDGRNGTLDRAAADVAGAVARLAGGRR